MNEELDKNEDQMATKGKKEPVVGRREVLTAIGAVGAAIAAGSAGGLLSGRSYAQSVTELEVYRRRQQQCEDDRDAARQYCTDRFTTTKSCSSSE